MRQLLNPLSLALLALLTFTAHAKPQQRLVMVGGGEHPKQAMMKVYQWAGAEKAHILVIPWATAVPEESLAEFAKDFEGLPLSSMTLAPLAPLTSENRALFLQQLDRATGVWFTGGDQVKVMQVLEDKELLKALRDKYQQGTVFSGTSAGTAIMSRRMLTGVCDLTLLDGRQVEIREGLGLLPDHFIVDQHFLKRQRQNRLFGLMLEHPNSVGLGVDEDTALVLTDGHQAEVIGKSQVMVVQRQKEPNALLLHMFKSGDQWDLGDYR